jgi:signal transduction histidine kinase/ActR/RegA family two-component response regulator
MDGRAGEPSVGTVPVGLVRARGRLFRKYALLFAVIVSAALVANGLIDIWFSYREQNALLMRFQQERADAAAAKIGQFVKEIEGQIGWTTQLAWTAGSVEPRRLEALRLLRQVPAIIEVSLLDASGREQIKVSRLAMDMVASQTDRSKERGFVEAVANRSYYGPVYFRHASEPYMTIALAGARREAGVSIAEVNLRFIWDVVSQIKVGERGHVYVVDAQGRLIAHPDISLVLSNSDFTHLSQVRKVLSSVSPNSHGSIKGIDGKPVLAAHAIIAPLGWVVLVELPVAEAHAPIYSSILRSGALLAAALGLAVLAGLLLAKRMVRPIEALQENAMKIGAGDLGRRISIRTGDELEVLGEQFNSMAAQLERSYAMLERRVRERTRELELANLAKSRFLAAASHDLRQPLHALGLFFGQLRSSLDAPDRDRIVERVDAAITAMNELFNALLDISKLDAGTLAPEVAEFPIAHLLNRVETTFSAAAREKGLRLRVVPSSAWIRSDPILLERILLNLVSNAVHYTGHGGIVVGCRRPAGNIRIDVQDSGIGIPADQQRNVFAEFYRIAGLERDGSRGLGLGLAIVDRLGRLLGHRIEVDSQLGRGSRFSVLVPLAEVRREPAVPLLPLPSIAAFDRLQDRLIVVIDDDGLVRDGMSRLLQGWQCHVVTAASGEEALSRFAAVGRAPDLIISDYRLANGRTGLQAIDRLRGGLGKSIPALLISGDTAPEPLLEVKAMGYQLLHKPVAPTVLRATLNHLLRDPDRSTRAPQATVP